MTASIQNMAHDDHLHDDHHHEHLKEQAERDNFGFWLYILSDCMIFATLFACYGVMSGNFAQQTEPHEVFEVPFVLIETILLLVSSFTFGMAMLGLNKGNLKQIKLWMSITFVLGVSFVTMELYEFNNLAHEGVTPQLSGYWSAFFTLVATHGLHVTAGLIWMIVMFVSFSKRGLDHENVNRMNQLSVFWHFLDIIWICVFTFVYLLGQYS
ncbi:cytochrome o ubiquinol oxidase subunit III [Brackiella oedipodis]|uniref:cytochrome o ubiquinol oxidase subunit III n=1 Tax=Brackiella oedipodis TaxID=124225 RepID=UPI00048C7271|nr:cytochrome o ubiquinol oxidase subunit III [Brackiella oedipodis]